MKKTFTLLLILSFFFYISNAQNCNNWLSTPSNPSYAEMGQINITGNKITVEATFNRTSPYSGGLLYAGDLVSKHNTTSDVNYLLRPNTAEITTTDGYFRTPDICDIQLNKTYHVAMVYDGATLKFYRNGFLMSQVAATGNLFQNSWKTRVGFYEPQAINTNFIGYINEVRIWNITKTQTELRTYLNLPLPNPTTQTGLVAYYTFDNLLNKQGNTAYNGVIGGAASINQTNPNCTFITDSCNTIPVKTGIGDIINSYTPIIALNPCDNKISVEDGSAFNAGDTVLVIQMKGAVIDSTNSAAFGTITNYKNAGNYEFNYVKSKSGNVVELKDTLTRQYDIPLGKVQLIRVPYYNSVKVNSTLTCLPWDGSKGGVLVLNVRDTLEMLADINTTGKGFLKGTMHNSNLNTYTCGINNYYYPDKTIDAAGKGEGITSLSTNRNSGRGPAANGGGGGMNTNSGGGGGSNGNIGGRGGYEYNNCPNYLTSQNWGLPGNPLKYDKLINKIFMGGAGGAGHCNNQFDDPTVNADFNGGNGGGLIIISSNYIKNNNNTIISRGDDAYELNIPFSYVSHDGMGGGGAGGTVLLNNNNYINSLFVDVSGGRGANMFSMPSGGLIGPGGGGGGGVTWVKQNLLPAELDITNAGGTGGVIVQNGNNPYGATAGLPGINVSSLSITTDSIPFKKNIDSVRIKDSIIFCNLFDFKALDFTRSAPITQWQWNFGDNSTATTQNTSHAFATDSTYTVKLIVTDINGCKDSITKNITISNGVNFDFAYKQDICNPLSVLFSNIGGTPVNSYWSFGDGNAVSANSTPTHLYAAPGDYIVKYSIQSGGCIDTITKTISVNIMKDDIIITHDTTICFNTTKQLLTKPALSFCWLPTTYLSDPNSPNPVTSSPQAITYFFTAEMAGANLITNGDFNSGNTGFSSQYNFANPNLTEGQYFVGPNPQSWNGLLSSCTDHTSGTGNMMLVNGASTADVNVWTQTVTVIPNTNYAFSTWIEALYPPNPAQLSFSINGGNLGGLITASLPTCTWNQFYTTWNSGNNTSATISIVNKNTIVLGNDFALDDISFSPVIIKRDSVKISIDTPMVKTIADTSVCGGKLVQLKASGAATYSWLPSAGLDSSGIASPTATPANTTQYIVTGINARGCTASDTVTIFIKPQPVITKTSDSTICHNLPIQLFAGGGSSYSWLPAATLNNPAIATPVATPTSNTTYIVTVTGTNTCSKTDSVKIAIRPLPVFTISPDKATCVNKPVTLSAGGGSSYRWVPALFLNDPTSGSPVTNTSTTTTYSVKIKDNTCNDSTTLSTTITVLPPPTITASKSNDIDCVLSSSQLTATGAGNYVWSPVTGLNNSTISNPVVTISSPQQYLVTGTDTVTSCTGTATIAINIKGPFEPSFFVPNAFSPNGDGKNDCFKVKHFGTVKSVDLSIYNRVGNLVFHTFNINDCWDGTYKGSPADTGNYVYYIKTFNECGENTKKGNLVLMR